MRTTAHWDAARPCVPRRPPLASRGAGDGSARRLPGTTDLRLAGLVPDEAGHGQGRPHVELRGRARARTSPRLEDREWLRALVERLTARYEADRADPWHVTDAPEDFVEGMLEGIVGIEIPIRQLKASGRSARTAPPPTAPGSWRASARRRFRPRGHGGSRGRGGGAARLSEATAGESLRMTAPDLPRPWPEVTLARVPYWVYQDEGTYRAELRRIFEGPVWNYLCLESDIARPGDYRTSFVGEMPVIAVRGERGEIHVFENRCAHRGALIALDDGGSARHFQCVYHAWSYDLRGNLVGIAFKKAPAGSAACRRRSRRRGTGRASCGRQRWPGSSSRHCARRRRRSRSTWATRCWGASSACCENPSRCSAASPRPCRTTGSSTSRTSGTPITPACCTRSSAPSGSRVSPRTAGCS